MRQNYAYTEVYYTVHKMKVSIKNLFIFVHCYFILENPSTHNKEYWLAFTYIFWVI